MSSFALQQAVYAALTGALAATVYDAAPRGAALPYVVIGEGSVNDFSTKTESGSEHLFTVHVWSRDGGMKEARALTDAVRAALDGAALTLSDCALVGLAFQSAGFTRQSDGETLHAALRFRAVTEP
jgi:hypothetical protein